MSFIQLFIYKKGELYSADCLKCGRTMYTHEWTTHAHNELRDGMKDGTTRCDDCGGQTDPTTFSDCGKQYAVFYSAPSYMDCTTWYYGKNKRALIKELRDMYADES
jgi:hypothetical protein